MKRILTSAIISALLLTITGCDAMWGTSVDYSPTPGATISVSSSTPGAYLNPLYWGSDWYPGIGYYPSGKLYPGPVRPATPGWGLAHHRPTVNVRPPQNNAPSATPAIPSTPTGNSRPGSSSAIVPPAGTFPNISSAEPGIVTPPSGSGLRPGRK